MSSILLHPYFSGSSGNRATHIPPTDAGWNRPKRRAAHEQAKKPQIEMPVKHAEPQIDEFQELAHSWSIQQQNKQLAAQQEKERIRREQIKAHLISIGIDQNDAEACLKRIDDPIYCTNCLCRPREIGSLCRCCGEA